MPVLLRVRALQDAAAPHGWRLLRVLFVRLGRVPACANAAKLLKLQRPLISIFPNGAFITCLVGAMMLEQNDEWSLNRRYMRLSSWGKH